MQHGQVVGESTSLPNITYGRTQTIGEEEQEEQVVAGSSLKASYGRRRRNRSGSGGVGPGGQGAQPQGRMDITQRWSHLDITPSDEMVVYQRRLQRKKKEVSKTSRHLREP
eukprot:COSAG01_NODE_6445_length_3661_cov_61.874509_1_plen_111_part_00